MPLTQQERDTITQRVKAIKPQAEVRELAPGPGKLACVEVRYGAVSHEIDLFDPTLGRDRTAAEIQLIAEGLTELVPEPARVEIAPGSALDARGRLMLPIR